MILLDTSALYALGSSTDVNHAAALATLDAVEASGEELLLHTYVLAETFALVHRRVGLTKALEVDAQTAGIETVAVDRMLHDKALAWLRGRRVSRFSLVDAVSFVVMAERRVDQAFAFDPDFERAGFRLFHA